VIMLYLTSQQQVGKKQNLALSVESEGEELRKSRRTSLTRGPFYFLAGTRTCSFSVVRGCDSA